MMAGAPCVHGTEGLCVVNDLGPSKGAPELKPSAHPLTHDKLQGVVNGIRRPVFQLRVRPVRIDPRVGSSPKKAAVWKNLRDGGISFRGSHEVDPARTRIGQGHGGIKRQLSLHRQVVLQHVRLLQTIINDPKGSAGRDIRNLKRNREGGGIGGLAEP